LFDVGSSRQRIPVTARLTPSGREIRRAVSVYTAVQEVSPMTVSITTLTIVLLVIIVLMLGYIIYKRRI